MENYNKICIPQDIKEIYRLIVSQQVSECIKPLSEKGILLPRTAEEVFENFQNWRILANPNGELHGFFEIRKFDEETLEMGSVYALKKGIGTQLLQIFETARKQSNIPKAFAITKDINTAQRFFKSKTNGTIGKFPKNFNRATNERYCINWK